MTADQTPVENAEAPVREPPVPALEAYLALGFAVDAERSASDLSAQLAAAAATDPAGDVDPAHLLATIITQATYDRGAREVAIPLTGGYDSRALLGAALQVFPASAITTWTFGPWMHSDCRVAARIARACGVRHQRLDPMAVTWDDAALTIASAEASRMAGGLARVDGVCLARALSARMPGEVPVLVGYFGDVTAGCNVHLGESRTPEETARAQWAKSDQDPPACVAVVRPQIERVFAAFMAVGRPWLAGLPGYTPADLVDFGFRQRWRLRPAVVGAFAGAVAPFEDPRWIGFWGRRPVRDRLHQGALKSWAAAAFPRQFPDLLAGRPKRDSMDRFLARLTRRLGGPPEALIGERGDPRRHAGLRAFLAATLTAFDARGRVAHAVRADLDRYLARPTARLWRRLMTTASAELHMRNGALA